MNILSSTMKGPDRKPKSLEPEYFERIYAEDPDPWGFRDSAYEREKYTRSIAALPKPRYERCLELGCSIGELSALLALRCDALLGIDVHEGSLLLARARNEAHGHVQFEVMQFPRHIPAGQFDLLVISEVAYYWGEDEFGRAQLAVLDKLAMGGHLLMVHYLPQDTDYPMSGDEVHDRYMVLTSGDAPTLRHLHGFRENRYRLDLFERI